MKRTLEFLTIFDWTVLLRYLLRSLQEGELGCGFCVQDSPWVGQPVVALLSRKGVRVWGVTYAHGNMAFFVKRAQAGWAAYVLQQAGVPLA